MGVSKVSVIYIYIDYAKNIKDTRVKVAWLSHYQSLKVFLPHLPQSQPPYSFSNYVSLQ